MDGLAPRAMLPALLLGRPSLEQAFFPTHSQVPTELPELCRDLRKWSFLKEYKGTCI